MMQQELRRASTQIEPIHIACEELNFVWTETEVKDFREMWKAGIDIRDMAKRFKRQPVEVALLVIDQARSNDIAKRLTGIFGI